MLRRQSVNINLLTISAKAKKWDHYNLMVTLKTLYICKYITAYTYRNQQVNTWNKKNHTPKIKPTSFSSCLFSSLATGIAIPSSQSRSDIIEIDIVTMYATYLIYIRKNITQNKNRHWKIIKKKLFSTFPE